MKLDSRSGRLDQSSLARLATPSMRAVQAMGEDDDVVRVAAPDDDLRPLSDPITSGVIDDVLDYVTGDPALWPRTNAAGTHDIHQVLYPDRGVLRFAKFGRAWRVPADAKTHETWGWDDQYIWHLEDSSSRLEPYQFTTGLWMRRRWTIGERLRVSDNRRQYFEPAGACRLVRDIPHPYETWIETHWLRYWCGPDLGERAVMAVIYDPTWGISEPGRNYERYYFARGAGWFAWESLSSVTHQVEGRSQNHRFGGPLVVPIDSCLPLPDLVANPRPHPEPQPEPEPEPEEPVSEIVGLLGPGGQYLRVDPADLRTIHFDRDSIGPHEECEVTRESDGTYTLRMAAANVILNAAPLWLCGTDLNRQFETRPPDARGPHEAWTLFWTPDRSRIVALVFHEAEGRRFTSAPLTVVRR